MSDTGQIQQHHVRIYQAAKEVRRVCESLKSLHEEIIGPQMKESDPEKVIGGGGKESLPTFQSVLLDTPDIINSAVDECLERIRTLKEILF